MKVGHKFTLVTEVEFDYYLQNISVFKFLDMFFPKRKK